MSLTKVVLDVAGVCVVGLGAMCIGLAIGVQLSPTVTSVGLASARHEFGQTRPLDDGVIRRRASLLSGSKKPDAIIPPVTNGRAPVVGHIATQQPVVFLTIDDGNYKDASVTAAMKRYNLKASLFLSDLFIWHNPQFFTALIDAGSLVENHTDRHDLKMVQHNSPYQQREICGMSDIIARYYGRRPVLFRPPGGRYNDDTQRIVAECGMRAIMMWSARVERGVVEYQDGRTSLRAGDIVLMHFRPEFVQDLEAFVAAKNQAKLRVELLEDWVK